MKPPKIPPILAGVAGEYYVAAELSRRGFIASISLRNTRGTDILAANADASRTITIQVKTSQKKRRKWILSEQSEKISSKTHFYVFVNLGEQDERPDFHIVPSEIVAKFVSEDHKQWISTPGRGGKAHVDNAVRNFEDFAGEYLEKWKLLGL